MKITYNKILSIAALVLLALCFVNTNAFGQKTLSVRCPAATANATVLISKSGDIVLTPCPDKNVKIGSANLSAGGSTSATKYKATDTARVNNKIPAIDPAFTQNVEAGVYRIDGLIKISSIAGGYFQTFGGTATRSLNRYQIEVHGDDGSISGIFTPDNPADLSGGAEWYLKLDGTITFSSAGTFTLLWSQSAVSSLATTVLQSSYLTLTKIS